MVQFKCQPFGSSFVALFFVALFLLQFYALRLHFAVFSHKIAIFIFLRQIDHHRIDLLRGGVEQLQKFGDIQPIALLLLVCPMALPTEKKDYFYEKVRNRKKSSQRKYERS